MSQHVMVMAEGVTTLILQSYGYLRDPRGVILPLGLIYNPRDAYVAIHGKFMLCRVFMKALGCYAILRVLRMLGCLCNAYSHGQFM